MDAGETTLVVTTLLGVQALVLGLLVAWWKGRGPPPTSRLPAELTRLGLVDVGPRAVSGSDALPSGSLLPPGVTGATWEGTVAGRPVSVLLGPDAGSGTPWIFVRVAGAPAGTVLRPQTRVDGYVDSPAYQEKIGDPAFDDAVLVRGDPTHLRALLDAPTRAAVRALLAERVGVGGGELLWTNWGATAPDAPPLDTLVPRLVAAVDTLDLPRPAWPARLTAVATGDPLPRIRVDALACLTRLAPAEAAPVARALLDDPEEAVALAAALHLGPEGLPTLLGRLGPASSPATWVAALPSVSAAPGAHPTLIRGLHHPDDAVAVAVAAVLGRVGGRDDIEVLQAVRGSAERRGAAEEAVRGIQARLGPVEAGWVAVAEEPLRGALSAAETAGQLSTPAATVPGGSRRAP